MQRRYLLFMVLVLIIGAALRLYLLSEQPDIATADAPNMPVFDLMLRIWRRVAGQSDFAMRLMTALMSVTTIAAVYAIGAALFDRVIGMIAALFAAVSPLQVWFSQQTRVEALFALLAALSVWLTIKVLNLPGKMIGGRFNRREAAISAGNFVLINALGLYTHPAFPLIMLAETLIFALWLIRRVFGAKSRGGSPIKTLMHGLRVWLVLNILPLLAFAPYFLTASLPETHSLDLSDPLRLASTLIYGLTLPLDTAREGLIPLAILMLVGLFPPVDEDAESWRYLRFAERVGLILVLIAPLVTLTEAALLPANLAIGLLAARGLVFGIALGKPTPVSSSVNSFFIRLMMVVLAIFAALPMIASLRQVYRVPVEVAEDYHAAFGNDEVLSLDGFALSATQVHRGESIDVVLTWHTDQPLESRYKVFIHLYAADGTLIAQHDSEPANFTRPTDTWQPNESIHDPHTLVIPLDAPFGEYRLVVGVYGIEDGARLPAMLDDMPKGDLAPLAGVEIIP